MNPVQEMRDALLNLPDEVIARLTDRGESFPAVDSSGLEQRPEMPALEMENPSLGSVLERPEIVSQMESEKRPAFDAIQGVEEPDEERGQRWNAIEQADAEEKFATGTSTGDESIMERIAKATEEILEILKKPSMPQADGGQRKEKIPDAKPDGFGFMLDTLGLKKREWSMYDER